jgi:heparin binding hemagglutinin HbhA
MTQPKTNRIPAPIYAAAGAGELALQQLRKLPATVGLFGTRVVADLGGRAVLTGFELRQKATETLRTANETAGTLRDRAQAELDLTKLRESTDLAKLREVADLNKLREVADLDKLRAAATRNAAVVVAGAQAAQERAFAAYGALVARGERVVGAGVLEAAETVNADIEATQSDVATTPATAPTTAPAEVPTPADVAEVIEAKPAAAKKATRAPKAAKPAATPSAKLPRATKRTRPAAE